MKTLFQRNLVVAFIATLFAGALAALAFIPLSACRKSATWSDRSPHSNRFATVNGVRLNYLDWGGSGPVLILIHGYGFNPHIFDDLAPAFTDSFRVIAYARRGHGQSEAKGPYDTATLTEDLRGLMDALGIAKAHLAGWSMGGYEVTMMAAKHPERVDRIVYLDAAYDWADPFFVAAFNTPPYDMPWPPAAFASLDAYRAYSSLFFPGVTDASRLEACIRDQVEIQPDGTVRERMNGSAGAALYHTLLTDRRDYTKVKAPALAIYAEVFAAETMFDSRNGGPEQRARIRSWEQKYMAPFRAASIAQIQRELPHVEIVNVPGTHMSFFFVSRGQVVNAMRQFLGGGG